ncbi:MAG: hypothetical protein Q4C57_08285 [Bacillota bacterium]|nr:hypothetical protein [Bacillota bacterium]
MITGTIKNVVKLQFLENKWQQKKNDINAKKPIKEMTQEERMLADFQKQVEKERESNLHADLYNKLKSGGKLTSEEISYLEQNDPEALRKYREDQAEKKAYERELKNCKTKDEVDRVKMNKLGNFAAQAKKITTDPYIPLDKKVELMNQLNDKLCRVNQAHMEFLDSQQYRDMPTEAELLKERTEEITEMQEDMQEEVMDSISDADGDIEEKVASDNESEELAETNLVSKEKRIPRKETENADNNTDLDDGMNFETLSEAILRFVSSAGSRESKIDISL